MLHSCGKLFMWLNQSCDLVGMWKFLSTGPRSLPKFTQPFSPWRWGLGARLGSCHIRWWESNVYGSSMHLGGCTEIQDRWWNWHKFWFNRDQSDPSLHGSVDQHAIKWEPKIRPSSPYPFPSRVGSGDKNTGIWPEVSERVLSNIKFCKIPSHMNFAWNVWWCI